MYRGDIRGRLNARVDSVRRLIQNEANILRNAVGDIVERFDLDEETEPLYTRDFITRKGSLIKIPVKVAADTLDNVVNFIQEQASINRRVLRR